MWGLGMQGESDVRGDGKEAVRRHVYGKEIHEESMNSSEGYHFSRVVALVFLFLHCA